MLRTLFTYAFTTFSLILSAQPGREAFHWMFGNKVSLDFSSGAPVAGIDSMSTLEGCASISDPITGNLLFYTDGTLAWNRNNQIMPHGTGMHGSFTSTQSALIIPKPGTNNIYYLLSADQGGYYAPNSGVFYSVVDMSLDNGLGDVSLKNHLLTPPPTTEKLVAIKHCNGRDFWVLTHPFYSDAFYAYLVTSTGIDSIPVISHTGTVETNFYYTATIGCLKASPNGKKLALGIAEDLPILEFFDFDNATGRVNHPITRRFPSTYGYGAYGISFSPDNSKVYAITGHNIGTVYQYDLTSGDSATILASELSLCNIQNPAQLQLGPDRKIYISTFGSFLSVINSPDSLGYKCNVQLNAINVAPASCGDGLPNFIDGGLGPSKASSHDLNYCISVPHYTITAGSGYASYVWSTGDTSSSIFIDSAGSYWVNSWISDACVIYVSDTFHVQLLKPKPTTDSTTCGPITVNADHSPGEHYVWSDGSQGPIKTFTVSGTYMLDVAFTAGCSVKDTFNITVDPFPMVNTGLDFTICDIYPSVVSANCVGSYLWNTGDTTEQINITSSGSYWVKVTSNKGCVATDTVLVTLVSPPVINIGNDTTFCKGEKLLNAYYPNSTYSWNTGSHSSQLIVTQPGVYWVTVNNGCIVRDSLIISPDFYTNHFELPNILTPNDDGINEFLDFGIYDFKELELLIFNRWGNKIFQSSDTRCIWRPSCPDGTYYYTLSYIKDCGVFTSQKTLKGFLTVIR